MKAIASLSLLVFAQGVLGHGGHEAGGPAAGETIQQYAQRHMSSEHHIDSFDVRSFHHLHDLDRDGYWNRPEIEAIYGVHHVYSTKKSKDQEEHQKKADYIVDTVLQRLDLDKDGRISPDELEKVGLDGLPNFEGMGAEGHHYDVESEFFLHHEEQFHSTPETQTDDAYNHPEDLEHFAQHEIIEREEAEREAKYQGISVEEVLRLQADAAAAAQAAQQVPEQVSGTDDGHEKVPPVPIPNHPHDEQVVPVTPVQEPPPKVTRLTPPEKQDPKIRFKDAPSEAKRKGEWGTGEGGYKPPREPSDKMRKNLPYKNRMQYKFRRNWGDF
ncbi:precursor to secretory protein Ssp120 [Collybia nuda]|uniref:Precursor to secretory protein Ssp120 n=1 Tax=Collybia nuda TaxID=64659 RepID=A0A9P5YIN4_9AGAR|nr:precursor to secretory protein Ssp120 [Collybia nuda]